jgi:hypothetical protein
VVSVSLNTRSGLLCFALVALRNISSVFGLAYTPSIAAAAVVSRATVLDYNAPGVSTQPPAAGTFGTGLRWAFNTFNSTSGLNQDCIAAKRSSGGSGSTADCMFAEHVSPYIRAPLFALQSQYDAFQTGSILAPGRRKSLLSETTF